MADSVKDLSPAGPLHDSWRYRWRAAWHRARRASRPRGRLAWLPVWSVPAAMRAVRATLVMPSLFALTSLVIGDPQMTLFAVFGSFATLVLVSFGGTRRDKALAHLGLALTGSAALVIGTLVSGTAWLAALVTIPVTFAIFFAGVAGPNAAAGVLGALLAYILPVASPAAASTIPSRLAGWWLASVAGTAAVLLLSPRSPGDRLRARTAAAATAVAAYLGAAVRGVATAAHREASLAARHELKTTFTAAPHRPTGLATAEQGMANVVELLEWTITLVCDALDGHLDLTRAAPADRELLAASARLLGQIGTLLAGKDAAPDIDRLQAARAASVAHQRELGGDPADVRVSAALAAHAQSIAIAAEAAMADTLIATRRADPEVVAAERRRWYGRLGGVTAWRQAPGRAGRTGRADRTGLAGRIRLAGRSGRAGHVGLADGTGLADGIGLTGAAGFLARHASLRSVWFRNSARGSAAIAAAVTVANLGGVQHGFWVALGTLSVLRTTAASTGATALRALAGTVAGFLIGAGLLLLIGTSPAALWTVLPLAVFVAAYSPGTAPFAVGQAAFTITIVVVFNLLAPAGWQVGLLRIEDVAIGCAVSLIIGIAFWPRGTAAIVGDDLADAFRQGGRYLTQAVDWTLGLRQRPPESAIPAVTAGARLDEALRAYLTEQGTKRLASDDLWALVMGTTRLRLTAYAVASLPGNGNGSDAGTRNGTTKGTETRNSTGTRNMAAGDHIEAGLDPALAAFRRQTADLVGFYERLADQVGPPGRRPPATVALPAPDGADYPKGVACAGTTPAYYRPDMLWVGEQLHHLAERGQAIVEPAAKVAELRQLPWWR
jgi:Fusaric acid resistance protein-like